MPLDVAKAQAMEEEVRAIDAEARVDELEEQLEAERRNAQAAWDEAANLRADLDMSRDRATASVGILRQMQHRVRNLPMMRLL